MTSWIQQIKSNSDMHSGVTLKQMKIQQIIVPEDWKWKDKAKQRDGSPTQNFFEE